MMVVAGSFYVTSNQATLLNYAIQAADFSGSTSSYLQWKCNCQPLNLHAKYMISGNHNFQLLETSKLIRFPKVIVFALPNDNKGSKRGESSNINGDPVVFGPEDASIISQVPGDEVNTTLLHSGTGFVHDADEQGNQENLLDKLKAVRLHVLAMEQWNASRCRTCHRNYLVSAINLIHHLALKSLDTEQLQRELSSFGLLNLETINPHVLSSLSAGIHMLGTLENHTLNIPKGAGERISISRGLSEQMKGEFTMTTMMQKVSSNSVRLFGTFEGNRIRHIMVTVGEEAADSQTFITDLINAGATIFRINCAHGNTRIWSEIIRKIKKSSNMLEKPSRILMDLAGPKLRTGKFKDGPSVVKLSPKKDALGNVERPVQVWLAPRGTGLPPLHVSADAVLYVDGQDFFSKLEANDVVRFSDAHGKRRNMKITTKVPVFSGDGFVGECSKTAYVESGTELYIKDKRRKCSIGLVVDVPPVEQFVKLKVGDLLIISRDCPNDKAVPISSSVSTHRITCSSGYLFDSVKPGEPIAFDDGKIWGTIKGTSISEIVVSITHAAPKGTKLGSEKSINIPQSDIKYEGLTSKDIVDLDFVASHADMVGISFVRDVKDIVVLRQELAKRKIRHLGVVLKIETRGGVDKLPLMILEAMKSPNPLGIMIARGDLAVECGWENLADIQEEIISICRAAHVPVIWATQVLESLVKSGVPTRAEITDVAVGKRTNCVMLNKGKHIVEAVSTLDAILNSHSVKVKAGQKALSSSLIHQ